MTISTFDTDALAVASTISEALAKPGMDPTQPPRDQRTLSQSLAGGAAGMALLHITRAHTGHGDPATADTWLRLAAAGPVSAADNANLFFGAPTLAYLLHIASERTPAYQGALAKLDDAVVAITTRRLTDAHRRIDNGEALLMREFDLIHGLVGLGVHLLRRHPDHDVTRDVLAYLVRLTEPKGGTAGLPSWWMPTGPSGQSDQDFPDGHGNFGLSHGIAGVLALLSLSVIRGAAVPGVVDAIGRICAWTDQWLQCSDGAAWWPGLITLDQHHIRRIDPILRPRPSWCYGIAGAARAQQLAGLALRDARRQELAEEAILAVFKDPDQLDRLDGPGLCHGTAGLLQSAWRIAADALTPSNIHAELPQLTRHLIEQLARSDTEPELMDGTAGAALTLHSVATGVVPDWDAFLLLS
ncbi:lanthionine synthetase C family protein [Phytomonospora endophytica]|uniref:Lanthionine synthetase n=1 Tax=Phytomonospora endophytica TaxID=714109 RepID=A0A841FVV8_9ACTN|nr:lanthionine synthetase C family protein [Phytomonospora endophytica]MBB6037672.1 hypothetical protein [Phytomonospora endophytica]GIG67802.1 hypothetical protein Pen01_40970 [Phytomonospora endophytica]